MLRKEQPKQVERNETSLEKLEGFLRFVALELREKGVPVSNDFRIDPKAFASLYPPSMIAEDEKEIAARKDEFRLELREGAGELEMLKTAIFHKNLGSRFLIVRASPYDDIKNEVDNIMLDRETGTLVCAFDEVGQTSGSDYEGKKQRLLEKNVHERGAKLKYGVYYEKSGDRLVLKLGRVDHVPIFYLALPPAHISEGVRKFDPSSTTQSKFEEKLFAFFVSALEYQVRDLELKSRSLAEPLKTRLLQFKTALKAMKKGGLT